MLRIRREKKTKQMTELLDADIWLALPLYAGIPLYYMATMRSFSNKNRAYYKALRETSVLFPASWVFPLVWTVLYCLIAASGTLFWNAARYAGDIAHSDASRWHAAFAFHWIGLVCNFAWYNAFFGQRRRAWFYVPLTLVIFASAVVYMALAFSVSQLVAAGLYVPYVIWCAYALVLTIIAAMYGPKSANEVRRPAYVRMP